jgi:hypothetical protein
MVNQLKSGILRDPRTEVVFLPQLRPVHRNHIMFAMDLSNNRLSPPDTKFFIIIIFSFCPSALAANPFG